MFKRHLDVMEDSLSVLKREAKAFGGDPDWPWSGLVLSFATLGGSSNWDNRIKKRKEEFSWAAVSALDAEARKALFHGLPNPRFRSRVEGYVELAFQRIKAAGGPSAARAEYDRLSSGDEHIAFFLAFDGIGKKYARNIPMDVHDPLVCDSYALDHRLKGILAKLTGREMNYREGEEYLRAIARELGIDGWTFDRVLYGRYKEIMHDLEVIENGALAPA